MERAWSCLVDLSECQPPKICNNFENRFFYGLNLLSCCKNLFRHIKRQKRVNGTNPNCKNCLTFRIPNAIISSKTIKKFERPRDCRGYQMPPSKKKKCRDLSGTKESEKSADFTDVDRSTPPRSFFLASQLLRIVTKPSHGVTEVLIAPSSDLIDPPDSWC